MLFFLSNVKKCAVLLHLFILQFFFLSFPGRCLGEQAGRARSVSHWPESRLLWAHIKLPETRTAHYQWRDQSAGYEAWKWKRNKFHPFYSVLLVCLLSTYNVSEGFLHQTTSFHFPWPLHHIRNRMLP